MYDFENAGKWTKRIIDGYLTEGMTAVDATMGNGHDTLYLCGKVGRSGKVIAFDVQEQALINTRARLTDAGVIDRAELILDSHEHMDAYLDSAPDLIMFNLGWLPGAEHAVTTQTDTTLRAVSAALDVLREDGLLTICVYPGHAEGSRERDALLDWARKLDPARFDATLKCYLNQYNDPPLLIAVKKNRTRKHRLPRS